MNPEISTSSRLSKLFAVLRFGQKNDSSPKTGKQRDPRNDV